MAEIKIVVSRKAIRERYSLEDKQDINDALDSGLRAAHLFFQAILGTEWNLVADQKDIFYANDDLFPVHPNDQYRFRLKRAFVHATPAVEVRYAGTRKDLLDDAKNVVVPTADYYVDPDKGIVYLDIDGSDDNSTYRNQFFSVKYSSGFDDEVVDTQGTEAGEPAIVTEAEHPAPEWLKEAIIAWMGSVIALNSRSDSPDRDIRMAKEIQNSAADMVETHKRETAFLFNPVY